MAGQKVGQLQPGAQPQQYFAARRQPAGERQLRLLLQRFYQNFERLAPVILAEIGQARELPGGADQRGGVKRDHLAQHTRAFPHPAFLVELRNPFRPRQRLGRIDQFLRHSPVSLMKCFIRRCRRLTQIMKFAERPSAAEGVKRWIYICVNLRYLWVNLPNAHSAAAPPRGGRPAPAAVPPASPTRCQLATNRADRLPAPPAPRALGSCR